MTGNKRALGRGLSALIADEPVDNGDQPPLSMLELGQLQPGEGQPRQYFDDESLEELAESIKANGIIQPIVAEKTENEGYAIIAGERRWRAAKIAGLEVVPVIVRQLSSGQRLQWALIENIQRENLTPVEEAKAYKRLLDEHDFTQEDLAGVLGKSRSHVANSVRILSLPESILDDIDHGNLTMGHARLLVPLEDAADIAETFKREGMSVRAAEGYIASLKAEKQPKDVSNDTPVNDELKEAGPDEVVDAALEGQQDVLDEKTESAVAESIDSVEADAAPEALAVNEGDEEGSTSQEDAPVEAVEAEIEPEKAEKSADLISLEGALSESIGLSVSIETEGSGGSVRIRYQHLNELDRILATLTKK